MRVYRVAHGSIMNRETNMHAGPYQSGPYYDAGLACNDTVIRVVSGMCSSHADDDHPSPWWDGYLQIIRDHELCGMKDMESLKEWFDGWLDRLQAAGFKVYEFEVSEGVRIGQVGGQVVFDKNYSELIAVHELVSD